MLKKYKPNGEIEFTPVYFNSLTKLVINHRYKLNKSFQEILYRFDACINKGSGWIVESIELQYINISTYKPLVESSYIDLLIELSNTRKGLINVENNDQKCFLWCHVRHINLVEEHPGRIKKTDRRIASNLNYEGIEFPVQEKDFKKIEVQNKNKKWFCKSCLQCFSSKNMLIKHKEDSLSINGMQSVDVEEGIVTFENYSNQLSVPFKIYAYFECNLKDTEIYEGFCTKKYHDHVPCGYPFKVVCIDNRFSKPILVCRGENAAYEFIKAILKEYKYS